MHIEDIQDQVELALMREGEHKVARAYVLYREEHARERNSAREVEEEAPILHITLEDGSRHPLETSRLHVLVDEACVGLEGVTPDVIVDDTLRNLFDGVLEKDLSAAIGYMGSDSI